MSELQFITDRSLHDSDDSKSIISQIQDGISNLVVSEEEIRQNYDESRQHLSYALSQSKELLDSVMDMIRSAPGNSAVIDRASKLLNSINSLSRSLAEIHQLTTNNTISGIGEITLNSEKKEFNVSPGDLATNIEQMKSEMK